jgi:hypothetical protein
MDVFQVDVMICTTAYVKAKTADEAHARLTPHHFTSVEFRDQVINSIEVSRVPLGDPDLPDLCLSPFMTFLVQSTEGKLREPADFTRCEDT